MLMNAVSEKDTPLARALAAADKPQATALDAFKMARKWFLEGKRISLCDLAKELNVSRGKLYRWVGNKDLLLDEIIWSLAQPTYSKIIKETPGTGIEQVVEVHRRFMTTILSFEPLQQFVSFDPPYAVRILTRSVAGLDDRFVKMAADHIAGQVKQGHMSLPTEPTVLAAMIVRSNEALIYNDVISGRSPAIEQACAITRVLLSANSIPHFQELAKNRQD